MNKRQQQDMPEDDLPQEVVADLRRRYGPSADVPSAVDQVILDDATKHLQTVSRPVIAKTTSRRRAWLAASSSAVAAAVLLFAVWPFGAEQNPGNAVTMSSADGEIFAQVSSDSLLPQDVDRDGEVSILDAFALARSIDADASANDRWDQNGDGQTNDEDVDLIAMHVVML